MMKRNQTIHRAELVLRERFNTIRRTMNGELSHLNQHTDVRDSIDEAVDDEYQSLIADIAAMESHELGQIEQALGMIRDGSYGICEVCHNQIPTARLKVIPYATSCVRCQNRSESQAQTSRFAEHWADVQDYSDDDVEIPTLTYHESW